MNKREELVKAREAAWRAWSKACRACSEAGRAWREACRALHKHDKAQGGAK